MAILPTVDNLRGVLQRVIFVPIVYGFISLLPVFLAAWENSDRLADRLFTMVRTKENMFDFVIVGGGTAGALVASRLAEHYRVLLLEAGGTPSPFQTIPALALKFLNHPQTDWSHKTVPQRKACLNSINQQSSWSAGRALGGTTNINFMAHVRGNPMDYENWASITGDPSWGYAGVLPYFKRSETFSGTSNDPEARGHEGELKIRKPSYVGLSEDWIRAGQELGYPFVDLNGRHEEGFGLLQYPIYKGIRQSTYGAFLLPYHKSPRLTIRRYSQVRKVLFRDMNNMAYGVEYVRHGNIETAIATKEVILSAGTLGSSKLLMLSGIGPRGHLDELGIPVRSDLPVGRNLQDHLAVHLGPFFIKEEKSFLFDRDVRPENIIRWLFLGTGPITTTGYQGAASIASSVAKSRGEGNWPDLQLILHGQAIHQGYVDAFAYAYSLQEDELMQYYSNAVGRDSFHISIVGSRPTSNGQVLLSGSSINDPLVINPRYLEDNGDGDFKIMLEGVKAALSVAHNTTAFRRLGTEFTSAKLPGCHDLEQGTDAYWECYIRRYTITMHNPVGTVSLGQVVDSYLRVRGTRGLRVVDASIQPTLVSTGTAASTLMIAEKGADMILKDHGIPERDTDLYDIIFGRNGFFKKNPVLRILQREFDTINPLRAIFRPFTGSRDGGEGEEKERFTRNGRVDNPFLQVISTVFGNTNQADNSVSESSNVNVVKANTTNTSVLQRKSSDELFEEAPSNIISKNQWVLETPVSTLSEPPIRAVESMQSEILSLNQSNVVAERIEKSTGSSSSTILVPSNVTNNRKGKGGRRYALLQAILREQSQGATAKVIESTTTVAPTPVLLSTPVMTSTEQVKPVFEEVPFVNDNLNLTENEVTVDAPLRNKSSNESHLSNVVAKPIAVNPQNFNLVQLFNNNQPPTRYDGLFETNNRDLFGLPNLNAQTNDPNPTKGTPGLLESLNSLNDFMKSFNLKMSKELDGINKQKGAQPPFISKPHKFFDLNNNFSKNDNIFGNFLSAFNTNPAGNLDTNSNHQFGKDNENIFGNLLSTFSTTPTPGSNKGNLNKNPAFSKTSDNIFGDLLTTFSTNPFGSQQANFLKTTNNSYAQSKSSDNIFSNFLSTLNTTSTGSSNSSINDNIFAPFLSALNPNPAGNSNNNISNATDDNIFGNFLSALNTNPTSGNLNVAKNPNNQNNDNIFGNFLSALNTNANSNNKNLGVKSNTNTFKNSNNDNPLGFLFGNSFIPSTTPPPVTTTVPSFFNFGNKGNSLNNDNIFSSWFKPTSSSSQPLTSSWFKPLNDNQKQPDNSLSSWFKPSSNNQFQPGSSNWFQPFLQSTTTASPPNPLETLADLFLGDLKKNERKKVTQTLGAMFPGQNMMDFLGTITKKPKQQSSPFNLFDLGTSASSGGSTMDMLQTLLSLGKMMSHFQIQKPTERPPNIFDNLLSAFNPSTTTTKRPSLLDIFLSGGGGSKSFVKK